ncbi:MAG: class I SAM-dependent methyltransferase [Candidatus Dormibacteraeota bacterium]|nr:class I SAM-dependent methyltransferase [Candidatus Dormibacteraeota bacterium]
MANRAATHAETRGDHWDAAYRRVEPTQVSWYQPRPVVSLELISELRVPLDAPVLDVGGGASTLVDHLLAKGFLDVTVLDVSAAALAMTRDRLGGDARLQLVPADIVSWRPVRQYNLWHDRALFHFLVDDADRRGYLEVLRSAVRPGGHAIIAGFAPEGPQRCSGLQVARYGPEELGALLGGAFEIADVRREQHTTPAGVDQPFTWVAARARSGH